MLELKKKILILSAWDQIQNYMCEMMSEAKKKMRIAFYGHIKTMELKELLWRSSHSRRIGKQISWLKDVQKDCGIKK